MASGHLPLVHTCTHARTDKCKISIMIHNCNYNPLCIQISICLLQFLLLGCASTQSLQTGHTSPLVSSSALPQTALSNDALHLSPLPELRQKRQHQTNLYYIHTVLSLYNSVRGACNFLLTRKYDGTFSALIGNLELNSVQR